jgi:hypothetical protein
VGGRAGALYLANTLGNVLGSFLVGFVAAARAGQPDARRSCSAPARRASVVPLSIALLRDPEERARRSLGWVVAASLVLVGGGLHTFSALPPQTLLRPSLPPDDQGGSRRIRSISEG